MNYRRLIKIYVWLYGRIMKDYGDWSLQNFRKVKEKIIEFEKAIYRDTRGSTNYKNELL